ncbi:uncharacterized protein AB675_10918 [Cyphellophora attinorum]|uniref:F-box domain-containing protein n=1 Tax=Cyphellophora attinorum TaxID=1664694 RepID=A0A0N1NXH5_9EURO|nr:uncharacterized protein AB675_10918 [Phialophora attinorum]KPI35507.1 hypothetical protein AB675_10918 [Phialophora attinorum]
MYTYTSSQTQRQDPPTPYNIPSLGAAGGRLAPTLGAIIPGSILIGRPEFLPLNLVAHILAYLEDDPATLAVLCRTKKVLYYMALPLLWKNVTLRNHSTARRRKRTCDGDMKEVPDGLGGASPFAMGLNALVTHPNAGKLVRRLRFEDADDSHFVRDDETEACLRIGRISESAMILNICIRAALDKCHDLEDFDWNLCSRLMPTVYDGLSSSSNLKSLHIRMPSLRTPQPTTNVPAMKALRRLVITDYDPLCFPDDVSNLIYEAQQLEDLQVHFSPRMREAGEPSVQLTHLMRKNIMNERKLVLKRLGVYNFFGKPEAELTTKAANIATVEEFTSINSFGKDEGDTNDLASTFVDHGWTEGDAILMPNLKVWRVDQLHRGHLKSLRTKRGLKSIYLLNARHGQSYPSPYNMSSTSGSTSDITMDSTQTSTNSFSSSSGLTRSPSTRSAPTLRGGLQDLYLDTICKFSGSSLQHLIFPHKWTINAAMVAKLIRACPNLTQLSACIECSDVEFTTILLPFLRRLTAVRVSISPTTRPDCNMMTPEERDRHLDTEDFTMLLREWLSGEGYDQLRWVGMGERVWEAGGWEEVEVLSGSEMTGEGQASRNPETVMKRRVRRAQLEEVKDLEIWRMDSLDVI